MHAGADDPAAVAAALHARDGSARALGIELVEAGAGRAVCRVAVRPEMCNGFGIMHGGMTFLLADSAMAFASNTGAEAALATSAEIDWLVAVPAGSTLTATATQVWSRGRTSVWDVAVATEDGTTVALFRGRTRRVGRPVLDDGT